jgi:hypothetical protein
MLYFAMTRCIGGERKDRKLMVGDFNDSNGINGTDKSTY